MMMWVQVDPQDDLHQIAEASIDGDPLQVRMTCDEIEQEMGLDVCLRLIDPNMGASPGNARKREVTWQDEFASAGLCCDLADDSSVGRKRFDTYLKPDERTLRPRVEIHERCRDTITQLGRYVWDDYRLHLEKSQKQTPKDKHDDFPSLWKYLMNSEPQFAFLRMGPQVIHRRDGGQREQSRPWREAV